MTSSVWIARGDYSQIEARVICWLAGAAWKLDAFRAYDAKTGPDLYKVAAAGIYRVRVDDIAKDDPRRQVGKVSELALGFQGGPGALQAMAKGYGVKIPTWKPVANGTAAEPDPGTDEWIKRQWRQANPEVVSLWWRLEDAALQCMEQSPGAQVFTADTRIRFKRNSECLAMRLPSGRSLLYWNPKLVSRPVPWGGTKLSIICRGEDSQTKRWSEFALYGGLITENVVQATARDIMADALLRLEAAGLPPVLSVHDEAICEAPRARYPTAAEAAAAVETVMLTAPEWAAGLPITADASAAERYMKG